MDTTRMTAICRICCILVCYLIPGHNAATLEFCQTSDYTTNKSTDTGVIKSPGMGTEVRRPSEVPSHCTITISVCPGCRIRLTNMSIIDCPTTQSCFLRSASVTFEGLQIFFNISSMSSTLNATSVGRTVELLFQKSPFDAVTGQFGFYISYKVMRPEPIRYVFDPYRRFGTISNPGFPNRYTSNGDVFKFHFQAAPADNYLTLSFSDWYLSKYSKVTIQREYNSFTYDYQSDRPIIVTASTEDVLVTFETGIGDLAQNYIGFKATYLYVSGSPDDLLAAKDTDETDVFDSVFGGAISFAYAGPGIVDYVWVIPRSDLIGSGDAQLKLRIDSTNNLRHDQLEIRSGPTSDGLAVNWTVGSSLLNESGFYIRLRCFVGALRPIAFNAVFVWTEAPDILASGEGHCHYTDFDCSGVNQHPSECLKSKDLSCDGIRHCDDGADEIGCTATSMPCPSYWSCRRTLQRPICITRKCDGIRDCLDSTDELNCPVSTTDPFGMSTWHHSDDDLYANYSTLSIALPLVMLGIIIIVIVSFIVCIAIRRKRHLSTIRRTVHRDAPPSDRNVHYGAHGEATCISPPPYGDIIPYSNQGFITTPGQLAPPPYEEIAKPLTEGEVTAPPPPYLLSEESASAQPLREDRSSSPPPDDQRNILRRSGEQRTSPRHSGEQRTSPRHSGEQRTSPRHSGEQRTSPRHSGELRTNGSTDVLIYGSSQC